MIYGFFGALLAVGLLVTGGLCGWQVHKAFVRYNKPQLPDPGEQERRKMIEQQRAFNLLQNYTVERAYGMGGDS